MAVHDREINPSILVYTDLDGSLLDFHSYSFEAALPALTILEKKCIPLIICTSKTRAEIEKIRLQLKNNHPFISENGGAVFIPKTYFLLDFKCDKEDQDYRIIELGTPYQKIRGVLKQIQISSPAKIKGFGDLSITEVANLCGFSIDQARLSKKREYDEPFLVEDPSVIARIEKIASKSHLKVERGGRFSHLTGANDKGRAVSLLTDIYRKKSRLLKTIALGDSQNDLTMLQAVDFPVLVKKPDGNYDSSVQFDNLILASGVGPSGWNAAVLKLLDELI